MKRSERLHSSGQTLVLIVLSLAVVLTIVLFVIARSITDVAISSQSEESIRAFSAAEAGIEKALVTGSANGLPTNVGSDTYTANVAGFADNSSNFNYPIPMSSGDSMTVWFAAHDANGNIDCPVSGDKCFKGDYINVCWGNSSTVGPTSPAVEVSVFYNDSGIKIARGTADPYSGRSPSNGFSGVDSGTCTITGSGVNPSVTYAFQKTFTFDSLQIPNGSQNSNGGLTFARVRILYNDIPQPVGVIVHGNNPKKTLPSQGLDIVSTGTAGSSNREVKVYQSWAEPPSVFDYAIYSSSGLTKN